MENDLHMGPQRVWSAVPVTSVVSLQTTTDPVSVGPSELVDFLPLVERVGWFVGGFLAVVLVLRVLVEPTLLRVVRRRNRNNPTLRDAFTLYLRMFVLLVGVFVGAGLAGFGQFVGNSALVLGAATLAVGVAAQEVIGSLVSGMALVFDPEFNVGHYIQWADGEGVIQSIALRVTRVETPDGGVVTIPNTVLTNQAIARPYGHRTYRLREQIEVDYEADVDRAIEILERTAGSLDAVVADPPPAAYVDELGDDTIRLEVNYWIERPDHREVPAVQSTFAREALPRLERADVPISPPSQRDLEGRIEVLDEPLDTEPSRSE